MAATMFIRFENPEIEGESGVPDHQREIEILGWSHGFAQQTSAVQSERGGDAREFALHQNLTLTKRFDAATNPLLRQCWSGRKIGRATLSCYRPGANDPVLYLQIVLEKVVVSAYVISGAPGEMPVESISLDYCAVSYKYSGERGESEASHDLLTNSVA